MDGKRSATLYTLMVTIVTFGDICHEIPRYCCFGDMEERSVRQVDQVSPCLLWPAAIVEDHDMPVYPETRRVYQERNPQWNH